MNIYGFFVWLNNDILALPTLIIFLTTVFIVSVKIGFVQIRYFPRFLSLIFHGIKERKQIVNEQGIVQTVSPFQAMFTAMGTTLGMGNIVGPSVAIMAGGPGALFWLVVYIFLASAVKFVEVVFALKTRTTDAHGHVQGGPMQYLGFVHPVLAYAYGYIMSVLFMGWSGLQANTLANIFALESIPHWITGCLLAALMLAVVSGGIARISEVATTFVPIMFVLYITFACLIIFKNPAELINAFKLIGSCIFSPACAMGGFMGASIMHAMRHGIYRGILITEAGVGTSSIPHSLANTQNPIDQGILAACSTIADALLSIVSGLVVLVSGVWTTGMYRSTLIYEAFKIQVPVVGSIVLLISVSLLVITTVLGNSFNGTQSFGFISHNRGIPFYLLAVAIVIIASSLAPMPLAWEIMDTVMGLVAVINLSGIIILLFRRPLLLMR